MTDNVKFPHVKVKLVGEDGNAFSILAKTRRAMQRAGVSNEDIEAYLTEAKAGNYDHLLQVTMKTVVVE